MRRYLSILSSFAIVALLAACSSETGAPSSPGGESPPPGTENPGDPGDPKNPDPKPEPAKAPTVAIDPSFAGGAGISDSTHKVYATVPGPSKTTYVALRRAGGSIGWGEGTILRRYGADGTLDMSFATKGELVTRIVANPQALAVDAQGRVLIGGTGLYDPDTTSDTGREIVVVRVTPAGTVDGGYGSSGRAILSGFPPPNTYTTSLRVRADGGTFVAVYGRSNGKDSFGSFLVGPGGAAISGYGTAGFASSPFPTDGALAVADDVLVPTQSGLARYGADGTSKGTAIAAGIVAAKAGKDSAFTAIVADDTKFTLGRFSAAGVEDSAFKGPEVSESFTDFEVLADGSVLLAEKGDVSWISPTGGAPTVVLDGVSAEKLMVTEDKKLLVLGANAKVLRYTF